jgi:hypothetical protein
MRKIPAATVALAAVAVVLAAPASADQPRPDQVVTGAYSLHFTDGSLPDTSFNATSCGIGCAQINFSNATGQGQFYADRWNVAFPPNPAAWRCPDGTVHRGVDNLRWDPATGIGTMLVIRNEAACGYTDHSSETVGHPMTVSRLGSQLAQPGILAPVA